MFVVPETASYAPQKERRADRQEQCSAVGRTLSGQTTYVRTSIALEKSTRGPFHTGRKEGFFRPAEETASVLCTARPPGYCVEAMQRGTYNVIYLSCLWRQQRSATHTTRTHIPRRVCIFVSSLEYVARLRKTCILFGFGTCGFLY